MYVDYNDAGQMIQTRDKCGIVMLKLHRCLSRSHAWAGGEKPHKFAQISLYHHSPYEFDKFTHDFGFVRSQMKIF
jgi:hypothetical protein